MFCYKCGAENDDNSQYCWKCGILIKKEQEVKIQDTVEKNKLMDGGIETAKISQAAVRNGSSVYTV